jgi:putative acetyltransferase
MPANVRAEAPSDLPAIRRVNELAFVRPNEADLVDDLRCSGVPIVSLVAVLDDQVVGHILFSPVAVDADCSRSCLTGLAPMSVLPPMQRRGIGGLLVHAGLEALRARGDRAVVVLGHPQYYPRFGFVPASRHGLRWEVDCPDEAFMALELVPGSLAGKGGVVRYRPEFSRL